MKTRSEQLFLWFCSSWFGVSSSESASLFTLRHLSSVLQTGSAASEKESKSTSSAYFKDSILRPRKINTRLRVPPTLRQLWAYSGFMLLSFAAIKANDLTFAPRTSRKNVLLHRSWSSSCSLVAPTFCVDTSNKHICLSASVWFSCRLWDTNRVRLSCVFMYFRLLPGVGDGRERMLWKPNEDACS